MGITQVEFYLSQLCMVVALGEFSRPACLVDFILELCESDLRIAHKTHWFLKAFCTGGDKEPSVRWPSSVGSHVFGTVLP